MFQRSSFRTLSLFACGLLSAAALFACDSGSGNETSGGGGTSATTSSTSGMTTTGMPTGSSSSTSSGMPGATDPIDTMVSNSGSILATAGRTGAWYTYNDGTGTQTPTTSDTMPFVKTMITDAPAGLTATFAAETYGSGFMTWGAGMGFDFNNVGGVKSAYDGSSYTGITFWAKAGSKGDASGQTIRLGILDGNTAPEGGKCDSTSTTMNQCSDAFGSAIALTTSWQQFTYTWAQLAQEGWGKNGVSALATNALYSVHFQAAKSANFDIFVSYIAFTK